MQGSIKQPELLSAMERTQSAAVIIQDGILLNREHLDRSELVDQVLQESREGKQHVVLGSPPATGKTSVLQLLKEAYCDENVGTRVMHLQVNESMNSKYLFSLMEKKGIFPDVDELRKLGDTLILIDDAQNAYQSEFNGFWQFVVKHLGSAKKQGKLFVVIASTCYMEVPGSPVVFRTLPHFPPAGETASLSSDEADSLFHMHAAQRGYESWTDFRDALKEISNCHIGVIIQGLVLLETVHKSSRHATFTEKTALSMLREDRFLDNLFRCFPVMHDPNDENSRMQQNLAMNELLGITDRVNPEPFIASMIHAGIFKVGGGFASVVTNWYYNRKFFPHRSTTAPASIDALVVESVKCMSSSRLLAAMDGDAFPKEAAFQQLFNEAMSVNLPPKYRILPEMNTKTTKADGSTQPGELDFYINGSLQWALELLRNGRAINEHIKHFHRTKGKYRDVPQRAYLVVDCRPPKQNAVSAEADRCTLYFAANFKTCTCKMRLQEEVEIPLKP